MSVRPLSAWRWLIASRAVLLDVALGALVSVVALIEVADGVLAPAWLWAAVGLLSGAAVALLRQRKPLVLLVWLLVLHAVLPGGSETEPPFYYLLALIVAFSLGSRVGPRPALLALAALVVSYAAYTLRSDVPDSTAVDAIAGSVFIGVFAALGFGFAASRGRAERLETRAAGLIAERERHARAAVEEERTRIARELHDAVAHDVSMMTLQLGALRHRLRDDQATERAVLGELERAGRESVDELRRIVGILRQEDERDRSPRPSMAQLEDLVERVRDAGTRVDLELEGDFAQLPAGIDASGYRIAQEALTNALRHAPGAVVALRVACRRRDLEIEVVNGAPARTTAPPSNGHRGHGLIGMRERAALFGAELRAGPRPDGGFRVHARFPLAGTVDAQDRMPGPLG